MVTFRLFAPPGPDLAGVRTTAGEFNEGDLSTACDKKEIVANVICTWLEKGENRPTLCYGVDRKHAQHLQERFLEAGIAAEYVDCDTAMFDREDIFDRFRAGETKLICNVATLDTGIDLDVRCIIDARPTKSRIRFVQTIGRGLRPGEGKSSITPATISGLAWSRTFTSATWTTGKAAAARTRANLSTSRSSSCVPNANASCHRGPGSVGMRRSHLCGYRGS